MISSLSDFQYTCPVSGSQKSQRPTEFCFWPINVAHHARRAHQLNSSVAQAGIKIGSWSFYGVLQFLKTGWLAGKATFRVTYLANTVPNKESLSPKGFTNRRSGPIYFELKVLIADCVILDCNEKKHVLNVAARNREEHFQRNLSNWLRRYHENDSAKYHFYIQLIWNGKFW